MNFELGEDELALVEAARDALSRTDTLAAMRSTLDGAPPVHLWEVAVKAGWTDMPDLLHGQLVLIECGRRLAPTGLLGHLTVTHHLRRAAPQHPLLPTLLSGQSRAAYVPSPAATLDLHRLAPGQDGAVVRLEQPADPSGEPMPARAVPDALGADYLLVDGELVPVDAVTVVSSGGYDPSRPFADVTAGGRDGAALASPQPTPWVDAAGSGGSAAAGVGGAWLLAQALHAAESLGAAEAALELGVAYAKQRRAFGRSIGSFQAVKHKLTDVLRLNENARSLVYFAALAHASESGEFALAACAARLASDKALDAAARACVAVHGGIGATWEHDAHLYYRRAQLSRLLLGGEGAAADVVAQSLLEDQHG